MLILVIDDLRSFDPNREQATVEYARDADSGIGKLRSALADDVFYDELWLDFDLGEDDRGPLDVMPVVRELEQEPEYARVLGSVFIHTSSPVGASRIAAALGSPGVYEAYRVSALESGLRIPGF